jgi:hypothetical protein
MEIIKNINNIGAAASMAHQIASGEISFNAGRYQIDNSEAIAILSVIILDYVDKALDHINESG